MEVPLKVALINFFVQLETTDLKWKEFVKNSNRPIHGLKNQSEQYCHVISHDVDTAEICRIDGFREKLIFKIRAGIEDEISLILRELRRLKNFIEDLKMKFNRLENVRSDAMLGDPSFKELVNGTPYIPRLDLLMEWSIESYIHFRKLYDEIFESFKILDYKSLEEVQNWAKSIDRHERNHERIECILGFTQFLAKESVK